MSDVNYFVYGLSSSESPEVIRYIGITANLHRRLSSHRCDSRKKMNKRAAWIKSVLNGGHELLATVLEEVIGIERANEKEVFYIKFFKAMGARLVNGTIGGDGVVGAALSDEAKKRMSQAKLKNPTRYWLGKKRGKIPGTGAKVGHLVSESTRRKISESHTGKKMSDSARRSISEAQRGRKRPDRKIKLTVTDFDTGDVCEVVGYDSLVSIYGFKRFSVLQYFYRNQKGLFLGRYKIEK